MNTEEFKRRLTAILSADVEGYSRLMREDEEATIRTLTTYRNAMTGLIQQYRGRVVDSPGDNILAEFSSVIDAVNCAVEMQRELAERNADLPENRKMQFRIGVNLGDVVEEGKRIYGDGVNIAARMESLAEGGGICISGIVYDQVKHKLGLEYENLGEKEVKNIAEPVPAYRVLSFPGAAAHRVVKAKKAVGKTWRNIFVAIAAILVVGAAVAVWHFYFRAPPIEVASIERMAFPLPDKPSIAVMPFVNMSGDPEQDYFSDGLSEEIITALSKTPDLFVIARNSTFIYKGKSVKVQQIAEELGVSYVLEGSVRKAGDNVRITAQLVDAISGKHLWAERYDRELKEIFALQDEITMKILSALQVKLTIGEQARSLAKGTDNIEAYLKILQARALMVDFKVENLLQIQQLAEEAISLDPKYPAAYDFLGKVPRMKVWYGLTKTPGKSLERSLKLTQKALVLDENNADAHSSLSIIYNLKRQFDKAINEIELAISLQPSDADLHANLGRFLHNLGRTEESVAEFKKAIRLNPHAPSWYLYNFGVTYWMMRQHEKAIALCKRALERSPDELFAHMTLAAVYSELGRAEEASASVTEVLRIKPKFNLEWFEKMLPWKNKADVDRMVDALLKAGIPEKPPLPLPDKPSIAVLPFVNMSGDPEQEYFSDGITEEIITALSKIPNLFVIARNSTFTYKGRPIKVQRVGRELGVKYVLEGSVRKSGDKVRITAQLVDTTTGGHLWAERYDRELKDIFVLQDEITLKIISAMRVKLTEGEQVPRGKGTDNLEAYLKVLQGREYYYRRDRKSNTLARQMFEEAIDLDPEFATAYVLLGLTHFIEWVRHWSRGPQSLERAFELTKKAIALDHSSARAHGLLGFMYLWKKQHEKAIAEAEMAIALDPNDDLSYAILGDILNFAGRSDETVRLVKKAMRLNPHYQVNYLHYLGHAYRLLGRYEEAIEVFKKILNRNSNWLPAHTSLAAIYSELGREEEARAEVREILRISPNFSLKGVRQRSPYKDQAFVERKLDALRKAGLK